MRSALVDAEGVLVEQAGDRFLRYDQPISQDFIDSLRSERLASAAVRAGEMHRVASVPTACYDVWSAQGLDPYRWTAKELLRKLRADGLDSFICSAKSL